MKITLALTALLVFAAAAPALAAKPSSGTGYAGFTSSGAPIALQVTRSGKKIARAAMELTMTCKSGDQFPFPDRYKNVPVKKTGSFRAEFANQLLDEGQGRQAVISGTMTGKFNRARTKVSGIWHLHVDEKDAAGTLVDQCDSGNARFSATQ
jgi:hypothetical protein